MISIDPKTALLISTLAAILAIVGHFLGFFKWLARLGKKARHSITRHRPRVPRETIRVVTHARENWWGMGSKNKEPAMQVSGHLNVTNITDEPVRLLATRIVSPRKARTDGMLFIRHPEKDIYGSYPIIPKGTTEVSLDFWVQPPILGEAKNLKTTVILVDQFGNEHKVKLMFKGREKKKSKEHELPGESIYKIADPVEKEIAAILKAEVARYRECGRPVGGLGSVQTTYQGNTWPGLGTEWRKVHSPLNQSIASDPDNALIQSDNASALLNLYHKLPNDKEKSSFVNALLSRLSRDTEYAPIGYLILFVLFRIGRLPEALTTAKKNQYKDPAYGFSDFLRLLDGLLRFEHPSFTSELLDEIEKSIEGLDEHTFRIRERISAIHAHRLNNKE